MQREGAVIDFSNLDVTCLVSALKANHFHTSHLAKREWSSVFQIPHRDLSKRSYSRRKSKQLREIGYGETQRFADAGRSHKKKWKSRINADADGEHILHHCSSPHNIGVARAVTEE